MKKVFVLVSVLMLLLVPFTSLAGEESGTYKDINWYLDKKGNLSLEGGETVYANGPWLAYGKDIKTITVGDGITLIKSNAFVDLKNLKSVTLGKDVITIEDDGFSSCKNLKTLILLGEKTIIRGKSFYSSAFTELILPENSNYIITNNCVLSKDGETLIYCLGGKNVNIPDGVKQIQSGAFWCNQNVVTVTLPASLTMLSESAFGNCDKLKNITIPDTVQLFEENAFWDCYSLENVVFQGEHITISGLWTFGGCSKLKSVVLPAATFKCDNNGRNTSSFMHCKNLQMFVFSEGTKEIPGCFFDSCYKLQDVYIPSSVKKINDNAFSREMKKLVIRCIEGSYAEQYAKEFGYKYKYYIPVQSISLTDTLLSLKKGKQASLKQTLEPSNVTIKDVMWFSTNESVATVNKGKVKTCGAGECDIICQAMDGSGVRSVCHIVVEE